MRYLLRLALCLSIAACGSDSEELPQASYSLEEGPAKGATLKLPKGGFSGNEEITIEASESVMEVVAVERPDLVASLGPALDCKPDGAFFDPPAVLYVPFSSKAYDLAREAFFVTHLVVLAVNDSYVGMEVGPVGRISMEVGPVGYIGMEVGPVGKTLTGAQLAGKSFGSIAVIPNEGNDEFDLLAVISVDHFTKFEVFAQDSSLLKCEPDCDGKVCGDDDGCKGTCTACNDGLSCLDGSCVSESDTCKGMLDCFWNCKDGPTECDELCQSTVLESEVTKIQELKICIEGECNPQNRQEEHIGDSCVSKAFHGACEDPFSECVHCTPSCEQDSCADNGCGVPCVACGSEHICDKGACVSGSSCETAFDCLSKCPEGESCAEECLSSAAPVVLETLQALRICIDGICSASTDPGCEGQALLKECKDHYNGCMNQGCTPDCNGKSCGDNGCGGSCGTCNNVQNEKCQNGACVPGSSCQETHDCLLSCNGKDACELCFSNAGDQAKDDVESLHSCLDEECPQPNNDPNCIPNAISSNCSAEFAVCINCIPDCTDKSCGSNGCGGICAFCEAGWSCEEHQCVEGESCHSIYNCVFEQGIDGTECIDASGCEANCIAKGSVPAQKKFEDTKKCVKDVCDGQPNEDEDECIQTALHNQCADFFYTCIECSPQCADAPACGNNGCGGSCGTCEPLNKCTNGQCVPGASCKEIFECEESCEANQECVLGCYANADDDSKKQLSDFYLCLETACGDTPTEECLEQKKQYDCNELYAACWGCTIQCDSKDCGTNGCYGFCGDCEVGEICEEGVCNQGQSCPEVYECLSTCIDSKNAGACGQCTANGTKSSKVAAQKLNNCATINCSTTPAANLCLASSCASEYEVCYDCAPSCAGKTCGDSGCGWSCGECPADQLCLEGQCFSALNCDQLWECVSSCSNPNPEKEKSCIDSCYLKAAKDAPDLLSSLETCLADTCGTDPNQPPECKETATQFGGTCYTQYISCNGCVVDCNDKECGDDGCGGSCSECAAGFVCEENKCVVGVDCEALHDCAKDCWYFGDNKFELICFDTETGPCNQGTAAAKKAANDLKDCVFVTPACQPGVPNAQTCIEAAEQNECLAEYEACIPPEPCQPACVGKFCGDDGCGGTCGQCESLEACSGDGVCVPTGNCEDVFSCVEVCGIDQNCKDNCIKQVTDADSPKLQALALCVNLECGGVIDENCKHNLCAGVYYECIDCVPEDCTGKNCGSNGCGGECGYCNSLISECTPQGQCVCFDTIICDDGKTCTTGFCSPQVGCVYTNVPDGTSCSAGGTCTAGNCTMGDCDSQGEFVSCPDSQSGTINLFNAAANKTAAGTNVVIGFDPQFSGSGGAGTFYLKFKIQGLGPFTVATTNVAELTADNDCGKVAENSISSGGDNTNGIVAQFDFEAGKKYVFVVPLGEEISQNFVDIEVLEFTCNPK